MALKIRLARGGTKKRPHYNIVIADSRSPRDGRFIEKIGFYNPLLPKNHADRVKLDLEKACATQMPELKGVVAWTIGGLDLVRLLDARGRPIMEFSEVESGTYEAQRPGEGIFFMENAATAASPVALTADQMTGDWGVVRGTG